MRDLTQAAEIELTDRVRVTLAANSGAARTSSNSRVRVVGQHFLRRHSTGEQIDDEFDRVAHATNARSAVAHGWVHRDSIKTSISTTYPRRRVLLCTETQRFACQRDSGDPLRLRLFGLSAAIGEECD